MSKIECKPFLRRLKQNSLVLEQFLSTLKKSVLILSKFESIVKLGSQ